MNNKNKKIAVIGAGPGGYEAAIMASKLGADVTIIEKDTLGGTCLNRGCIPTKVFLESANLFNNAQNLETMGININDLEIEHSKVLNRKNNSVNQLVNGIENLLKRNNVTLIKGFGKLKNNHEIEVFKNDGSTELVQADSIILATGSTPIIPQVFNFEGDHVITSNELLELENLPESIIIVGGNVVASEVSQYLARNGVDVTIIEALKHIIPFEDADVSRQLLRKLKKDGIKVYQKTRVRSAEQTEHGTKVITEKGKEIEAQKVLICIGRQPNTSNIGLENTNVKLSARGFVKVDENLKTAEDNIYAIGDIVNSPMLAHVASHEGITAVRNILGKDQKIEYNSVPRVIYTDPEIASVGVTEDYLKENSIDYKKGQFFFKSLGKAVAINKTDGFVKILTDLNNNIIGASIVGGKASEMISELTLAVKLNLNAQILADLYHPHPTLSEAILEACRDINNYSINKY